jgi:cobalt-precorrin 5A hydrolase
LAEVLDRARGTQRIDALAAPVDKVGALAGLGRHHGVPVIAVAPDALAAATTLTDSAVVRAARGVGSVAEAAALAAAGAGARLLAARVISTDRRATCALAEGAGQ